MKGIVTEIGTDTKRKISIKLICSSEWPQGPGLDQAKTKSIILVVHMGARTQVIFCYFSRYIIRVLDWTEPTPLWDAGMTGSGLMHYLFNSTHQQGFWTWTHIILRGLFSLIPCILALLWDTHQASASYLRHFSEPSVCVPGPLSHFYFSKSHNCLWMIVILHLLSKVFI